MSKESADKIILSLVEQYDADKTQKKAVDTIKKIFENILKFPTEQKYRRLKVAGKIFSDTLLPANSAVPLLYDVGFVESDDGAFLEIKEINANENVDT